MKPDLVIPPYTISLITTNKCTSTCKNCCFACNPKNEEFLSLEEMKNFVQSSIKAFPTIKTLVLTGGECFLLGKDLEKIITYGTEKGLVTRVVTNAYWAKSFKKSYLLLKALVKCGLKEINISTGDEHLEWVPYKNIIYAIIAAIKLNLTTVINIESGEESIFNSEKLKNDINIKKYFSHQKENKLTVLNGIWINFNDNFPTFKDKFIKSTPHSIINPSIFKSSRCTSLFNTISITSSGEIYSCCGLTSLNIPYLKLGNAKEQSIQALYEQQFQDFLKIWIFTEGTKKYMKIF